MIFVRETRAKVTQEFPDMNALDVMKEVGRRWQNITEDDKNYYQALADKDKERFKKENQQYMKELEQLDTKLKNAKNAVGEAGDEQNIDDDQFDQISKSVESSSKIGANGKKMRRDPSMPKKPLSAFIYFSQETREKIKKDNPKMPVASIMKEVGERWNAMSKQEKDPYVTAARDDKLRYEKEITELKKKPNMKNMEYDLSKDSLKQDEEDFEDLDVPSEPKRAKARPVQDDDSWDAKPPKNVNKRQKSDNKVQINLSEVEPSKKPTSSSNMQVEVEPPQMKSSPPSQFRFNLPDNKPINNIDQTPPLNYRDSYSGSTENNQGNAFMYRPAMFSPTPFGVNRSPGPSPNMMPSYSPMLMNKNDSYRDYFNRNMNNPGRGPSIMGQSSSTNINRNDNYNDYNIMGMSPSGFTPIRTNLQRNNPMFSPPQNMGTPGLFGPSPSMNNISYTPFAGYGRTPINQFGGNNMKFQNRPMNPGDNSGQDPRNKGQPGTGLFDLNPFG